jgi:hypothetical protein
MSPAPLPVTPASQRLRAHSPLRIPRQPRRATLLPLCRQALAVLQPQTQPEAPPSQGNQTALALSQMWRADGGHRETYSRPTPTPLATLSRRSRRMKLLFQVPHSVPLTTRRQRAPYLPSNKPSVPNLESQSRSYHTQTTNKPVLPSHFPTPVAIPDASLSTPRTIEFA